MSEQRDEQTEEQRIEALLQQVGPRIAPPEDLTRQVREAVRSEWRQTVAERARAHRVRVLAAAASFAALTTIGVTATLMNFTPPAAMAIVTRIEGEVRGDAGWLDAARDLTADAVVHIGDEIVTAADAHAAFHIDEGLSLQLDENSQVRLVDDDRLVLERGAVYVASDLAAARSATFTVATRNGTVRHIGTQYEVRTVPAGVQVSVREGRVVVDTDGALHEGKAGERIAIDNDGAVKRTTLARNDPHWRWIERDVPSFDIENQSLDDFLSWFSRQTGRQVAFASPEAAQAARATILRGSIEGLEPQAALAAVLATTELVSVEGQDGGIVIQRRE
jgi:ferric-dicitrate binding protein FerR (iron transport regulator)